MPNGDEGIGIGELSRQVRDVLVRFEGLAARLENQFVRADNFAYYRQLVDAAIAALQETVKRLATSEQVKNLASDVDQMATKDYVERLEKRVGDLEDDKKWLVRLVLGFIVLGVLGAVFAVTKAQGT